MQNVTELSRTVASRLSAIPGIEAVVLGGSHASGLATPSSDVDLGIYYDPSSPFRVADLKTVVAGIDDRRSGDPVTDFGEWGPRINGGAWLLVAGRKVDLLYRDLRVVAQAIEDCRAGVITCEYQPGHPHGFHNHIYMGEVHYGRTLFERSGRLETLKGLTTPYPPLLRQALVTKYLWEAEFSIGIAERPAERGDIHHVSGCLFRASACLVQVLFAVNETYFLNEKGSLLRAAGFTLTPPKFSASMESALTLDADPRHLIAARTEMIALQASVSALALKQE